MTFEKTFSKLVCCSSYIFNGQSFHRAQNDLSFFSQKLKILKVCSSFLSTIIFFLCFRVIDFLRPRISDNRTTNKETSEQQRAFYKELLTWKCPLTNCSKLQLTKVYILAYQLNAFQLFKIGFQGRNFSHGFF